MDTILNKFYGDFYILNIYCSLSVFFQSDDMHVK